MPTKTKKDKPSKKLTNLNNFTITSPTITYQKAAIVYDDGKISAKIEPI